MRLLFHAPNVHTGGGLRLMQDLFAVADRSMDWAQLDERVKNSVTLPSGMEVHYVRKSLLSRLSAEWRLWRDAEARDIILSFNGLPPLFPVRSKTVVFLQNRLLIETGRLDKHPLTVRIRLTLERLWLLKIRWDRTRYVVQTPSMAELLKRRLGAKVSVSVLPFAARQESNSAASGRGQRQRRFDYVYVSSGDAHKNHRTLVQAWSLLAGSGVRPSLAVTLDAARHPDLCAEIAAASSAHDLKITNLGTLSRSDVQALYGECGALIFPSTTESFGLPLIEAAEAGLSILAPELDYVRDVVEPVQTFDASSSRSIARAVLRHQGPGEPTVKVLTAAEFLAGVAL